LAAHLGLGFDPRGQHRDVVRGRCAGPVRFYLFCGAPIRFMLGSDRIAIARFAGTQLIPGEIDKSEPVPEGWENVSISKKPFPMTNVLAALLLGILRVFVN
jgi:hypothetical protein